MRIIQLSIVHPRYDTRITVKQCRSLLEKWSNDVGLVVADGKGSRYESGVPVIDLGKFRGGRAGRFLFGGMAAFAAMRKLRPEVVHFHDPELIPVGLLCKIIGMRVVYDVHENVPETILKRKWIFPWLRKPVSAFITITEKLAGKLFDRVVAATPAIGMRFPKGKTILIQNFPIDGEMNSTEKLRYERRPPEFAYVGGITRERAAIELMQALGLLKSNVNIRLHMAGNCRPVRLLKELGKIPGREAAIFHGWIDRRKMAEVLGRSRAGIVLCHPVPNFVNSQPTKLFEYMSAGLPVIASDFPLWRRIVEDAQCGIVVNPLDPRAIAAAMQWILDNPEKAQHMGEKGKRRVEKKYTWEAEAEKLISMYRHLLANWHGNPNVNVAI